MENNYYVGKIFHHRRFLKSYIENSYLYFSSIRDSYFDLISGVEYTTNNSNKDYVIRDSLVSINVEESRLDLDYLRKGLLEQMNCVNDGDTKKGLSIVKIKRKVKKSTIE